MCSYAADVQVCSDCSQPPSIAEPVPEQPPATDSETPPAEAAPSDAPPLQCVWTVMQPPPPATVDVDVARAN